MPNRTVVLSKDSDSIVFSEFSVVGLFNEADPAFVQHVALLDGDVEFPGVGEPPNEVRVYHMGPPLVSDPDDDSFTDEEKMFKPDLAVSLNLDEAQSAKVARWASRIAAEAGPTDRRRYTILPAVQPSRETSETGQPKYHRFSCAGYVAHALKQVEIVLCLEEDLPLADFQLLIMAYPDLLDLMAKRRVRAYMGIESDPPWPVLLPGYLFHGANHFLEHATGLDPSLEMAHYPARQN